MGTKKTITITCDGCGKKIDPKEGMGCPPGLWGSFCKPCYKNITNQQKKKNK